MAQECVVGDTEKPEAETVGILKGCDRHICLHIGFLCDIIGEHGISAAERHEKPTERFLMDSDLAYELLSRHDFFSSLIWPRVTK